MPLSKEITDTISKRNPTKLHQLLKIILNLSGCVLEFQKGKTVKFTLAQVMKAQRGSRGIALLVL
jgi:hypothetical protein